MSTPLFLRRRALLTPPTTGPASPVRGYSQKTGTTAALTINHTTDWTTAAPQSGDLIVVNVFPSNAGSSKGGSITTPTGYTAQSVSSGGAGINTYTRVANGTVADACVIAQLGGTSSIIAVACCLAAKTYDTTVGFQGYQGSATSHNMSAFTTGHNNEYVFETVYAIASTITIPSSSTAIGASYIGNGGHIVMFWDFKATAGAMPTRTWTCSPAGDSADAQVGAY
jgi:hypothetical protein